jgi:hypothetical protein
MLIQFPSLRQKTPETAVMSKFNVHRFGLVALSFFNDGERQPNLTGVEND